MTTSAGFWTRALVASTLACLSLTTACSAGGPAASSASSASSAEGSSAASGSQAHGEHGHGEHGHAEHGRAEHGHGDVASVLVTPADLPTGYVSGHAHVLEEPATGAVGPECAPLADLLRPHLDMQMRHSGGSGSHHHSGAMQMNMSTSGVPTEHGRQEATAVFTKSHFGPTISEHVVDLGGYRAAARATREVVRSGQRCRRYVQSSSGVGANRYAVHRLAMPADAPAGHYLRLTALGRDFTGDAGGIHWDVWVHDCDKMLVAVTFRSALGGDNADFAPAVDAVLDRLHPA